MIDIKKKYAIYLYNILDPIMGKSSVIMLNLRDIIYGKSVFNEYPFNTPEMKKMIHLDYMTLQQFERNYKIRLLLYP